MRTQLFKTFQKEWEKCMSTVIGKKPENMKKLIQK